MDQEDPKFEFGCKVPLDQEDPKFESRSKVQLDQEDPTFEAKINLLKIGHMFLKEWSKNRIRSKARSH